MDVINTRNEIGIPNNNANNMMVAFMSEIFIYYRVYTCINACECLYNILKYISFM